MPDVFLGEFNTDILPPTLLNPSPPPNATAVAITANVSFDLVDDGGSGVDLTTLNVTIGGQQAVVVGIAQAGFTMSATLIPNGYTVVIDKVTSFPQEEAIGVTVGVSDLSPIANVMVPVSWQFTTAIGVIETPRLFAEGRDGSVDVVWQVNPEMVVIGYELRRGLLAAPTAPDQGDLVYSGTSQVFTDVDVTNNTRYFYTVFAIRKLQLGVPVYVPYEPAASADATPRAIRVAQSASNEYVPKRGEFGQAALPTAAASTRVWGDLSHGRQNLDVIAAPANAPVFAPVSGVISQVTAGAAGLSALSMDSDVGGFRFNLAKIKVRSQMTVGTRVRAGELVGRAAGQPVEFSIVKLPTGRYGERTVRPAYFYLTLEARDGRR